MATAFNDSVRNQNDAQRVRNERAVAAMQLLASMNQTGATRYGADRTLDAARLNAGNESTRLQNLMTLGREQLTSGEKVAGLERTSRLELGQLPYSPEARAHALEIARLGVRPDPYMTRDIGQANIESIAMNDLAKSIAESANLAIEREEAELLKNLPGPDWWNKEGKIRDGLTKIVTGLDARLGENRQLLEFIPATNRYKPRVRALIPIPNGQTGQPAPSGLPAVPPIRQNQSLMTQPNYAPPMNYGGVPQLPMPEPVQPTGAVAVPIAQPRAFVAPTNAVPSVPLAGRIAADFTNARLPVLARPTPDEAFVRNAQSPMALASQFVPGGALLNAIKNAYQTYQGYGSLPASDPRAFGAQGSVPGYRPPAGAVAVPTNAVPSNPAQMLMAADLAELAKLNLPAGKVLKSPTSGISYRFDGSTWQPVPQ